MAKKKALQLQRKEPTQDQNLHRSAEKSEEKGKEDVQAVQQRMQCSLYHYFFFWKKSKHYPRIHYTKLFGLQKNKGNGLDLNMMCYLHGKDWDEKLMEALKIAQKTYIHKHVPMPGEPPCGCTNMDVEGLEYSKPSKCRSFFLTRKAL